MPVLCLLFLQQPPDNKGWYNIVFIDNKRVSGQKVLKDINETDVSCQQTTNLVTLWKPRHVEFTPGLHWKHWKKSIFWLFCEILGSNFNFWIKNMVARYCLSDFSSVPSKLSQNKAWKATFSMTSKSQKITFVLIYLL